MKNIFNLTKILLKNNFGPKTKEKVGNTILYLFLAIYFAAIMVFCSITAITALKEINQQGVYISLCVTIAVLISMIRSVFTSINVLYFSKDTEYLLPLPIKPKDILISKINSLMVYEYVIDAFLILIPMLIYGILENFGILYYLQMILIFILIPVIPVILVSFVMIFIMRFTTIIKNKDSVHYITIAIVMTLVIIIQSLSGGAANSQQMTNEELAKMLTQTNGTIELYSKFFISIPSAVNSVVYFGTDVGVQNLILFLIETILIYIVMIEISSKLYIKGLVGINSGAGKNVRDKAVKKSSFKKVNIGKAYIIKEFKLLTRNPVYVFQCVMPSLLFPIIFSMPFALNINNLEALDVASLEQIRNVIGTPFGVSMILLIIEFFFIFNFVSLTAVSRDGGNAIFMKCIPISLYKQCVYKIMPNIILNIIPLMYVLIVSVLLLKLNIEIAAVIFIFAMLINILQSFLMILVDLSKPKLEWTTEYAVVKQNMNMLYQMLFGTLVIIIIAFSVNTINNLKVFFTIGIAILLICVYIVKDYIKKNEYKLFKKII